MDPLLESLKAQAWIQELVQLKEGTLLLGPDDPEFLAQLHDGFLLCHAMECIQPGVLCGPMKLVDGDTDVKARAALWNFNLAAEAASFLGIRTRHLPNACEIYNKIPAVAAELIQFIHRIASHTERGLPSNLRREACAKKWKIEKKCKSLQATSTQGVAYMSLAEEDEDEIDVDGGDVSIQEEIAGKEYGYVAPKEEMLWDVAREILYTERDYCRDVDILTNHLLNPLAATSVLSESDVAIIFHESEALWEIGQARLRRLEEALRSKVQDPYQFSQMNPWVSLIHAIVDTFAAAEERETEIYVEYVKNQGRSFDVLKRCRKDPAFGVFLDDAHNSSLMRGLDIADFLMSPTQRVCRIPLLLRELLKLASPGDDWEESVRVALQHSQQVAEKCNEAKRLAEKSLKLEVGSQLRFGEHNMLLDSDLVKERHGRRQKRYVALFNDSLVYAKRKKGGVLDVRGQIPWGGAQWVDLPNRDQLLRNVFVVRNREGKEFRFGCATQAIKARFLEVIAKQIELYNTTKKEVEVKKVEVKKVEVKKVEVKKVEVKKQVEVQKEEQVVSRGRSKTIVVPNVKGIPPGWAVMQDKKSGAYFYFNQVTKETTWTRPSLPASLPPPPKETPPPTCQQCVLLMKKVKALEEENRMLRDALRDKM